MERNKPQFSFSHLAVIAVTVLFVAGMTAFKHPGLLRSLDGKGLVEGVQTTYIDEWSKHVSETNEILTGTDVAVSTTAPEAADAPTRGMQALQYFPGYAASVAIDQMKGISSASQNGRSTTSLSQVKGEQITRVSDPQSLGPRQQGSR